MSRPFHEVIAEIDSGLLQEELSKKLAALVSAVQQHEKSGSLTLKISVKPNGDKQVFVDADVKLAAPDQAIQTSMFFAKPNGDLSRENPDKDQLKIRAVS